MANFDFKAFKQLMQGRKRDKTISIVLHSFMLLLCLIGSVIFVQDTFYSPREVHETEGILNALSQSFWYWLGSAFGFIKIKIIIPSLIIIYFYYCITQNVFRNLFKDEYNQLYNQKYNKIHHVEYTEKKKSESLSAQVEESASKSFTMNKEDITSKEPESSLNMSVEMVKSMSRSMMGSLRSITGSNLNQSMTDKGNLSMRSSKVIQNLTKKTPVITRGKDLMNLFTNNKNLSESFMSQSSSGMEGDEAKIKIKAKKYYETINERQGQEFKKWYLDAFTKYREQIKIESKELKNYHFELSYFKKGLEKQLSNFLKEYQENYDSLKDCLIKFWKVKIQGFQSKKPLRSANELSTLFKDKNTQISISLGNKIFDEGSLISEKQLFKRCSSAKDFLAHLSQLKVSLRKIQQKDVAEKQLSTILSKMKYFNTLLNISSIEGDLLSEKQNKKIKLLQKCLSLLASNKIDIFSLYRVDMEFNDLDLFEEYDIETIKNFVEARTTILLYIVNKINLMSDKKQFKVKMSQAVTFDSGYLSTALQFFKNKNFAEIVCEKGTQNLFTHFNINIYHQNQGEEPRKETKIYCKPGIDNSISAAFFLIKELSQYLNGNFRYDERLTYDQKRRQKSLRDYIETLHASRRL